MHPKILLLELPLAFRPSLKGTPSLVGSRVKSQGQRGRALAEVFKKKASEGWGEDIGGFKRFF